MATSKSALPSHLDILLSGLKDNAIFTIVLILSLLLHVSALFGISFVASSPPQNKPQANIDITLVREQTTDAPEQADFLAQANNLGSGEGDEKVAEPSPVPQPVIADKEPPPEPIKKPVLEEKIAKAPTISPIPIEKEPSPVVPPPAPNVSPEPITPIVTAQAKQKIDVIPDTPDIIADAVITPVEPMVVAKPKPSAAMLMANSLEIAQLKSEVNALSQKLANQPRKLPLSSVSAKKYEAAAYLKGWQLKIERIGTINYPQAAKRQGISGKLMLSVDIHPNGRVGDIVISRSSGHKVLDDAAIKIVNLAAPYAPIPADVLGGYDMLTIIRTWNFDTSGKLQAR